MATNSLIEGELFHKITRDERQEECRRKWIKNRCIGTIVEIGRASCRERV